MPSKPLDDQGVTETQEARGACEPMKHPAIDTRWSGVHGVSRIGHVRCLWETPVKACVPMLPILSMLFAPLMTGCASSGSHIGQLPDGVRSAIYTDRPAEAVALCIARRVTGFSTYATRDGRFEIASPQPDHPNVYSVGPDQAGTSRYPTTITIRGDYENMAEAQIVGTCANQANA